MLNVGSFLVLYVVTTNSLSVWLHWQAWGVANSIQIALSFFLWLNTLIAIWEIALGLYIRKIQKEFDMLREKYKENRLGAITAFFTHPVSLSEILSLSFWTKVWSTYSLYDPSYSNNESFGFFVDVGNGWTTLVPSLLGLYTMTFNIDRTVLSPRMVGIIMLIKYYQEFYGTVIYFLSFFFNGRHRGKSFLEVALFVGFTNGLWFFFPIMGMYCSKLVIDSDSFEIFRL